ncbi:MAG: TRIC cation channel family protein [Sphingomicrobium sp.]
MIDANPIPAALELLDYFGIALFADSGALLAAEKKQTLVTFIFFAVATGTGGGCRDARGSGHRGSGGLPCAAWQSFAAGRCPSIVIK